MAAEVDEDGYPADGSPPSWLSPAETAAWRTQNDLHAKLAAETALVQELTGALRFILAFYEPGQTYLDTEAWKVAEAGARRVVAKAESRQ
jgi:hypothetical protein